MLIKSKYKIARRLGSPIFEKTQTQKYAARLARKSKTSGGNRPRSDYGKALIEKQKARFTYRVSERQFKNYAEVAIAEKKKKPEESFYQALEMRLDSAVYRAGFAQTRLASRQMVSHGHFAVNGKRLNVPSYRLAVGDVVSIMQRSKNSALFTVLSEKLKNFSAPSWIAIDLTKSEFKVSSAPKFIPTEVGFDILTILEFYRR